MEIEVDKIYTLKLTELERVKLCNELFVVKDGKGETIRELYDILHQLSLQ